MGQIKTSISIEENVSSAFKSMNTVVNSTLNTFQNFDNVINETPTMSNANESVLNSIAAGVNNASNSIQQLNNDISSLPDPGYWTSAVGHYDKSALEAVYTTEELVQMGFKTADALKAQETSISDVNSKVSELKANVSSWKSSQNIELFNSSGVERYQQEIQSVNTMTNKLVQTQMQIQNQANKTNILSNNAISDLNSINNRIVSLKNQIQKIEDNNEQERLINLVKQSISNCNGAIIRTSAEGKEEEIKKEIKELEIKWNEIQEEAKKENVKTPRLLYKSHDIVEKILIDLANKNL